MQASESCYREVIECSPVNWGILQLWRNFRSILQKNLWIDAAKKDIPETNCRKLLSSMTIDIDDVDNIRDRWKCEQN